MVAVAMGLSETSGAHMSQGHLPGVFGDVRPLLEHHGYVALGGFALLEGFGDRFEHYKWYVIGAVAALVVGYLVSRVGRRRAFAREKS
jgi:hypothetical protein